MIMQGTAEARQADSLLLPKDEARLMRRSLSASGSKLPRSALPCIANCRAPSATKEDSQTTDKAQAVPVSTATPSVSAEQNKERETDSAQNVIVHTVQPSAQDGNWQNGCAQEVPVSNARPSAFPAENDTQAAAGAQRIPVMTAREVFTTAQNRRQVADTMQPSPSKTAKPADQHQAAALRATAEDLSKAQNSTAALQSSDGVRQSTVDKQQHLRFQLPVECRHKTA